MNLGPFWCQRDKAWVRFRLEENNFVSAEIAVISPENPRITTPWETVKTGSWSTSYTSTDTEIDQTFYWLAEGKLYKAKASKSWNGLEVAQFDKEDWVRAHKKRDSIEGYAQEDQTSLLSYEELPLRPEQVEELREEQNAEVALENDKSSPETTELEMGIQQASPISNPTLELSQLPEEILTRIISLLNLPDIPRVALTSLFFQRLTRDYFVWKQKFQQHFPDHFEIANKHNPDLWYRHTQEAYAIKFRQQPLMKKLHSAAQEHRIHELDLNDWKPEDFWADNSEDGVISCMAKNNDQPGLDKIYQRVRKFYLKNDYEIDLRKTDSSGRTILFWMISCNQPLDDIHLLIQERAQINYSSKNGLNPLHIAAKFNRLEALNLLLAKGAVINSVCKEGCTPLHYAAQEGRLAIVNSLLKWGANIDQPCKHGWTPLRYAAKNGQLEVLRFLFEKGANIHSTDTNGWTPLHSAASNGRIEVLHFLLEKGADISRVSKKGLTPLNCAAQNGHLAVVNLLLLLGANTQSIDNNGFTPLHQATMQGHIKIIDSLLEHGANINQGCHRGLTPLHYAVRDTRLDLVNHLLEKGADIHSTDFRGYTPLDYTTKSSYEIQICQLIDKYSRKEKAAKLGQIVSSFEDKMQTAQLTVYQRNVLVQTVNDLNTAISDFLNSQSSEDIDSLSKTCKSKTNKALALLFLEKGWNSYLLYHLKTLANSFISIANGFMEVAQSNQRYGFFDNESIVADISQMGYEMSHEITN
jgi:ankyrin repeat protein